MTAPANAAIVAGYLGAMRAAPLAPEILDAAKMCLADWMAVCIGARETPEAAALRRFAERALGTGPIPLLIGGKTDTATAALINGALSHCLDYDDTHIPTALHASGPTMAAVLAVGAERRASEAEMLKAFVCGFEVGATAGSNRLGVRLNESGWHSTAILGRLGVAAASAYLMELPAPAIEDALGLAATQCGGVTASFGTMAKPFHAGKAAADGVLAAQLAQAGLGGSRTILDSKKGLFGTIFQDRQTTPNFATLGKKHEILDNSFKPYAACQLTHGPIDAALQLRERLGGGEVKSIVIDVNPLAIEIAGVQNARTPTEGRFSTAYCIALVLKGHPITPDAFVPERLADPELVAIAARVSLRPDPAVERTAARLDATLADGSVVRTEVLHAFGSMGNPMGWPQIKEKFLALVEPVLKRDAAALYDTLAGFEKPGAFERCLRFVDALGR